MTGPITDSLGGIKTSLKRIGEGMKRKGGVGDAGPGGNLDEETWSLLRDLSAAVAYLADVPPAVESLQRLDVKDGDIVLVRIGDPETGWIPGKEHEDRARELFEQAFKDSGVKATVIVYHYAVSIETIRADLAKDDSGVIGKPANPRDGVCGCGKSPGHSVNGFCFYCGGSTVQAAP